MLNNDPSLNEITTLIASQLDRELDDPFKRSLGLRVDVWRATLAGRSLRNNPQQKSLFRQTLWVPMEESKPTACNVALPMCPIARSKYEIPNPMRIDNSLFDYVGAVDGSKSYQLTTPGTTEFLMSGKYSHKNIFYSYTNKYIELAKANLPMIRVDAVFDNPLQVMELNCRNGIDCDYWDKRYPCSYDIIQMCIQYIIQVDYQRPNVPNIQEIEVNPMVPKNSYQ